jgi:uncharacterized membrane protein
MRGECGTGHPATRRFRRVFVQLRRILLVNTRIAAALAAATASAAVITLAASPGASAAEASAAASASTYYGTAKAGTGGLILRERDGSPTTSGIAEGTRFTISTTCFRAYGMELIKVHQVGPGGWGSKYDGYVLRQFANVPPNLPC